jgi:hypothetical protein
MPLMSEATRIPESQTDGPGPDCPACADGRLVGYYVAIAVPPGYNGTIGMWGWVAVCRTGKVSEEPDGARPGCGFAIPLAPLPAHPRRGDSGVEAARRRLESGSGREGV